MVADLKYVNSLEDEVDNLKSQMETQKTQFLNEIDRLSREYYYADHMNAILGIYTDLDEFTDLQRDMTAWSNLAMAMRTKPDVDTLSINDLYNNLRVFEQELANLDSLHEDLEQIDDMDIKEMDIKWQIAMIAIRMKKFYKNTGRRVRIDGSKPVGFETRKVSVTSKVVTSLSS
ncbi:hypothetical protein Tco_0881122 [Tanacetum coccineum]